VTNKYFKLSDFECKCDRKDCDAVPISPKLVDDLTKLREAIGMPFIVTSGSRCLYWNQKKNGSENSYHLQGLAVDFKISGGGLVYLVAKMAPAFDFMGIGISKTFVHLDQRKTAVPVMFGY
jgi:uncharacterized protein YcbK (DUF882 family)